MLPKFSSVKANARLAGPAGAAVYPRAGMGIPRAVPSLNPYTSASGPAAAAASGTSSPVSTATTPDLPSALSARRARPTLKFNARGKYIQRAEEMRHEAKMEALRQRIAENARKAGLDSEFEVSARSVKRQMPPEVEWWDAPLLRNRRYEDLDAGIKEGTTIYDEGNEYVTLFVQHPIPIPAPFEGKASEPRGLMLTKKVSSPNRPRAERRRTDAPAIRSKKRCVDSGARPSCRINEIVKRWVSCHPIHPRVRPPTCSPRSNANLPPPLPLFSSPAKHDARPHLGGRLGPYQSRGPRAGRGRRASAQARARE